MACHPRRRNRLPGGQIRCEGGCRLRADRTPWMVVRGRSEERDHRHPSRPAQDVPQTRATPVRPSGRGQGPHPFRRQARQTRQNGGARDPRLEGLPQHLSGRPSGRGQKRVRQRHHRRPAGHRTGGAVRLRPFHQGRRLLLGAPLDPRERLGLRQPAPDARRIEDVHGRHRQGRAARRVLPPARLPELVPADRRGEEADAVAARRLRRVHPADGRAQVGGQPAEDRVAARLGGEA